MSSMSKLHDITMNNNFSKKKTLKKITVFNLQQSHNQTFEPQ